MNSKRIKCPFCNSKKRDLKVWEEDGIVRFYCFGGSCGKRGILNDGTYLSAADKQYTFTTLPDVGYVSREDTAAFVAERYGFVPRNNTVSLDKGRTLLEFPLYYNGLESSQGAVVKFFDRTGLKSVFKSETRNKVYNDITNRTGIYGVFRHLIAFEDILSSLKFNSLRGSIEVYSCATLSCNITEKRMLDMAEQTSHLIVCLDADATPKAMMYAKKYKVLFNDGITVLPLSKDFKDMNLAEVQHFFERLKYVIRN